MFFVFSQKYTADSQGGRCRPSGLSCCTHCISSVTMRTPLTVVIVVYSTCCVAVLGSCSRDGPGTCHLSWKTCDWTYTAGWKIYYSSEDDQLKLKQNHNSMENIESRKVCSTDSSVHCLKFQYKFERDNVLDLSVFIKQDGMDRQELWKTAYSDGWDDACVPVKATRAFILMIEVTGSKNHIVFIEDIYYSKENCDLSPRDATPPPETVLTITTTPTHDLTTPSTAKLVTTGTFTSAQSVTDESSTESFLTEDSENRSDSIQAGDGSPKALQVRRTAPEESSSNIGLIVGVVVAVVFLLLIGLVPFFLFKRREQKQKTEDVHGSFSHKPAAYSLDVTKSSQFVTVDTISVSSQTGIERYSDTTTSSSSDSDRSSIVSATASDFSEKKYTYAEVNKPTKSTNAKPQQYHQGSDESPYEVQDLSENATTSVAGSPEDDYTRLNFHTRSHADHTDVSVSSTDPHREYSHLTPKSTALPSTARREEPGLYQNSANTLQTPQQKASQSLYQNVGSAQRHRHQQGPGLTSLPEQGSDLTREDASADVYTLPSGTASTLQPFTEQEDPTLPEPHCLDEENNTYHVLEEAPSSSYPDTGDKAEADYSHLDLQRSRPTEVRGEGEPAAVYNRLKEGEEGDYDRMDRGSRKDVIDGHYSHI